MTTHSTPAAMLAEFHRVFGSPDTDALWLRPTLHVEEHQELIEALEDAETLAKVDQLDEALPQVARELADVVYVAYGTALLYGIDLDAALREVHRANLSKLGEDGRPVRREDGKVLKGPNFRPPDMRVAIRPDCISCGEGSPGDECPRSHRSCGHHCNCSWVNDHCHWCGKEFGEEPISYEGGDS